MTSLTVVITRGLDEVAGPVIAEAKSLTPGESSALIQGATGVAEDLEPLLTFIYRTPAEEATPCQR